MTMPDMGVDPETMGPMEMPQDGQLPPEVMEQMQGVDPNSPPADPMLQQEPDAAYGVGEYETRERVELCVLLAIETLAKAVEVGEGASNPQSAQAYAQACASLGQTYASLTQAEQKEAPQGPAQPPMPSY